MVMWVNLVLIVIFVSFKTVTYLGRYLEVYIDASVLFVWLISLVNIKKEAI